MIVWPFSFYYVWKQRSASLFVADRETNICLFLINRKQAFTNAPALPTLHRCNLSDCFVMIWVHAGCLVCGATLPLLFYPSLSKCVKRLIPHAWPYEYTHSRQNGNVYITSVPLWCATVLCASFCITVVPTSVSPSIKKKGGEDLDGF